MKKNCAVILAAGEGTRMKSGKPKVLAEVLFRPMIDWVLAAVREAGVEDVCAVTGHLSEMVCNHLDESVQTVLQAQRLGTGHAVIQAKAFIEAHIDGNVLVLNGDAPLMDRETITQALQFHTENGNSATVISACVADPTGYGRMVRDGEGKLERIVEQRDATEAEKKINEVNSGAYWFNCSDLLAAFDEIEAMGRTKKEIYLTDAIEIMLNRLQRADAFPAASSDVILGANDRWQLMELNTIARQKVLKKLMVSGVDIPCLDGVMIAPEVEIESDTQILPNTILLGKTKIAAGCVIGPNTRLEDCTVGADSVINASQCERSVIGARASIGPFSHLRAGSRLGDDVHCGNYTEGKNSVIGNGTKISHLTYVGDSDVGSGVNFGCGCATANYDGKHKFRTTVGDDCFIGCDTCLVSPVTLGDHAYVAAGSVVTDDVPAHTMAIARSRQSIRRKVRKYHED